MDSIPVKGTCMLMCPESEIKMRQKENLVHVIEMQIEQGIRTNLADRHKMVKMFSRSAAGKNLINPEELRPPPVLKKTVNYLLSIAVSETRVPWTSVCHFISDRLRSVRQDMVVQQLPPSTCCEILESTVKFLAYSGYSCCEEPLEVFDSHLNRSQLNECLKQLLVCYDCDNVWTPERELMEALYGVLHLGDLDSHYRLLSLDCTFTEDSLLNLVYKISRAHFYNNYVRICRCLPNLPPLLACVAAQHLPTVRRKALRAMSTAYSSKNLHYPLDKLKQLLLYTDILEVANECLYYGLVVNSSGVQFSKGSFDSTIKESSPKRLHFVDKSLENLSLPELLLSSSEHES